jgi:hypothetical protein
MDSSSRKTNSIGESSSGMESNIYKRRKRKKYQSFQTKEFNKDNPPTLMVK